MSPKVGRSRTSTKKAEDFTFKGDSAVHIETGNSILDSLFNEELVDPEKYNQEIVQIIKNHLATKDVTSKAGTQLGQDLIRLAESGGTK